MFNLDQETLNELTPPPTAQEITGAINAKISAAEANLTQAQQDVSRWQQALSTVQAATQAQG